VPESSGLDLKNIHLDHNLLVNTPTSLDTSGLGGHPKGLTTLFFTEMWERFSYYGMRAILVLYMVAPVANGGLAFDTKTAASLSVVTKLAPAKVLGLMMGVWFLAASLGSKLAGYLAGFFDANDAGVLTTLYGGIAAGLLLAAGVLAALRPAIRKMMGTVH